MINTALPLIKSPKMLAPVKFQYKSGITLFVLRLIPIVAGMSVETFKNTSPSLMFSLAFGMGCFQKKFKAESD